MYHYFLFLRTEYPIIIFCTLMPAKVFGECVEKRKIHIPLMAGVSRGELFASKLMVTILPIWVVQLGSLTAAAILNHMFDFPYPASIWVSTLIGVLVLSLFVCSFNIRLSILLRKFSLAALLGIGLFAILDYWALQTPFENIAGYIAPLKSAMVLEEASHRLLAQIMAGTHVYPSYPPPVYNFSIPYLLLLPFLFMIAAAIAFRVIDLD
ncbi:MAG: hypothetical protein QW542_00020 [Thermoproteota archaeon]